MDLNLFISNGFVSSKNYDKRDDFDFDIVNFPFLDCDVPRRPSYGPSYDVYISQLINFSRVCCNVEYFNARNKCLTAKLIDIIRLGRLFSHFYRRHHELVSKFNVGLKSLFHQGLSEPEFYGD